MKSCPFTQPIRRIVVFRALQLGDLLCAVPAWRSLRAAHPHASITLVGLPWAEEFARRFNRYIDDFIAFPGYPGLPEQEPQIDRLHSFLAEMRRRSFDLFLQMQGCGTYVNDLAALCGARESAGYYAPPQTCPAEDRFMRYPEGLPEIHRHLRLMEFLGISSLGDHIDFPLTQQDYAEFDQMTRAAAFSPESTVCIHAGGRGPARRWSLERFAEVAEAWSALGHTIVLTGTSTERSIADQLAQQTLAAAGRFRRQDHARDAGDLIEPDTAPGGQ